MIKQEILSWEKIDGYWVGNKSQKKEVLLSAGIHPREDSWIYSLNQIVQDNDFLKAHTGLRYKVIPCRNERGFNICNFIKQKMLTQVYLDDIFYVFKDSEKYLFLLRKKILNEKYLLERIMIILKNNHYEGLFGVIAKTENSNIVCNLYLYLNCQIIDFNSYREEVDEFTNYSRNRLLSNNEVVWIDFHESIGYETFVYVDKQDKYTNIIAREYIEFCKKNCIQIRAQSRDRMMLDKGVFDISFMKNRKKRNCQELIIETGIDCGWNEKVMTNKLIIDFLGDILEQIL